MELYQVLLVDDEEDIREGISRKMDWLGLILWWERPPTVRCFGTGGEFAA